MPNFANLSQSTDRLGCGLNKNLQCLVLSLFLANRKVHTLSRYHQANLLQQEY